MIPKDIQKAGREKARRLHTMRVTRKQSRRSRLSRAARFAEAHRKLDLPVVDTRDIDTWCGMLSSCNVLSDYIASGVVGDGIRRTAPKPACP